MNKQMIIALAAVAAMASGTASAFEAGDWVFKAGTTNVDPEQKNGSPAGLDVVVDDDSSLSLTGGYFITSAIAVELLASLPFEHDYAVAGLVGGSTKHLPPTLSIQYHFNSGGTFIPYVGIGVNYTTFFSQKTYGLLEEFRQSPDGLNGAKVELDDSYGLALQAGIDYMFTEKLFMNVDVRYIDIEPDLKVGGSKVGKVEINPTTVGLNVGYRF